MGRVLAPLIACLALSLLYAAAAPPAFKPVSFAILEDYDKGASLDEVERDFALFAELGIRTWRGSFGWDDYEPSRNQYDFGWLHRFAAAADTHGLALHCSTPESSRSPTPHCAGRSGRTRRTRTCSSARTGIAC